MLKEVVIGGAGLGLGVFLDRSLLITRLYQLCNKMDLAQLTPEAFVNEVYLITLGRKAEQVSLDYWVSRWNDATDEELNTNLFAGSSVPIVGLDGTDSTRARTLTSLIVRSQLALSAPGP